MTREASLLGNVYADRARSGGHATASARAAVVAGEGFDAPDCLPLATTTRQQAGVTLTKRQTQGDNHGRPRNTNPYW